MDADAGETLIFVRTDGAGATVTLRPVSAVKLPELPIIPTVVVLTTAELLADKVSAASVVDIGLKDALIPLGRPEAKRLTLPAKPFAGSTTIVL